ncbi:MAG: LysR family transcriptional regulator [Planctomycetes bacterium]|nr:LysR family transcriptional regulator [Planctomycetota bacterium]
MIDLRHLRAIRELARAPSLTAAAQALHCTQSALSHLLADLEARLGLAVVERRRRPLRLTAAGRRLLVLSETVLPAVTMAEQELRLLASGKSGRLLISVECHSCLEWLAPIFDAYRSAHPDIELDLRTGVAFDPLPALRDALIDAVITAENHCAPWLHADWLFRYEIVGVLPSRSPLARRPYLEPSDFAGQTVITYPVAECRLDLYTRFLDPAGVVPAQRRTAELTPMIVQLVASGAGIAALPRWVIGRHPGVVLRRLGSGGLHTDLRLLRRSNDRGAAHIDDFVDLLRAHGQQSGNQRRANRRTQREQERRAPRRARLGGDADRGQTAARRSPGACRSDLAGELEPGHQRRRRQRRSHGEEDDRSLFRAGASSAAHEQKRY